jgi:hypothetical protein
MMRNGLDASNAVIQNNSEQRVLRQEPSQSSPQFIQDSINANTDGIDNDKFPDSIYRVGHSDIFTCHNCRQKGTKWYMMKHHCKGRII